MTCKVYVWKNSNYFDIKMTQVIQQEVSLLAWPPPELKAGLAVPIVIDTPCLHCLKLSSYAYCLLQQIHSRTSVPSHGKF